jgi:hypothetical protein
VCRELSQYRTHAQDTCTPAIVYGWSHIRYDIPSLEEINSKEDGEGLKESFRCVGQVLSVMPPSW